MCVCVSVCVRACFFIPFPHTDDQTVYVSRMQRHAAALATPIHPTRHIFIDSMTRFRFDREVCVCICVAWCDDTVLSPSVQTYVCEHDV
jgi:hypothetical protein